MTLSDALPVQFWLQECDTYNEFEAQGVHHVCWCAPWLCTDEILIQFQDTSGQTFTLFTLDKDGNYLYSTTFSEVLSGVYQVSVTPNDQSICDEKIQFLISGSVATIFENDFGATLEGWTNEGSGENWAQDATAGGSAYVIIGSAAVTSKELTKSTSQAAGTYRFKTEAFYLNFDTQPSDLHVLIEVYNGTTLVKTLVDDTQTIDVDNNEQIAYDIVFTSETAFTKIVITAERTSLDLTEISCAISYVYLYGGTNEAKSDCLDVRTLWNETALITYYNVRNFAGLIYENQSPDITFNLRVPCRFFHEEEPEEDEAIELTSSVVTTSSQVKTQRLLEIQHVPYYFHKKLRRVLKHQSVTIFDKSWKKEEKYEIVKGRKNWPLKSATCLLTEETSVVRNVL